MTEGSNRRREGRSGLAPTALYSRDEPKPPEGADVVMCGVDAIRPPSETSRLTTESPPGWTRWARHA